MESDHCYTSPGEALTEKEHPHAFLQHAPPGVSCYIILHCWCEKDLLYSCHGSLWHGSLSCLFFTNQFNVTYSHLSPSLSISFLSGYLNPAYKCMVQSCPEAISHLDNRMQQIHFYKSSDSAALSQNICHRVTVELKLEPKLHSLDLAVNISLVLLRKVFPLLVRSCKISLIVTDVAAQGQN